MTLLPVTLVITAAAAIINIWLAVRVTQARSAHGIWLGIFVGLGFVLVEVVWLSIVEVDLVAAPGHARQLAPGWKRAHAFVLPRSRSIVRHFSRNAVASGAGSGAEPDRNL